MFKNQHLHSSFTHLITLPTGAVAKYCDEHICVCACLSVHKHISGTTGAIFNNLSVHVAYGCSESSSGSMTKSQEEGAVLEFFRNDNALYSTALAQHLGPHTKTTEPIDMPFGILG